MLSWGRIQGQFFQWERILGT